MAKATQKRKMSVDSGPSKRARTDEYASPSFKKTQAYQRYNRTGGYYGRFTGPKAELKFFDTALSIPLDATAECGATAATGQIDLIPQGVTESTRVGRKATIKSIQIKGTSRYNGSGGSQSSVQCRVMLIQDTQCNGAQGTWADIYDGTVAPHALRNIENSHRFKVLKEWNWNHTPMAGVSTAWNSDVKDFSCYLRCDIPLEFSSTTGALGELRSNHIFLAYGAAGDNHDDTVTITANARVRFSDL